ncbi:hypothetical protein [Chitinophaga pinensis]|uniref:Uncharacterized protein n=1 Tax=Chitinophaga pinensis TaxID=79329 RepID=A0A5C6LM83_9BACT|nr:hypothetical protein [Chitinophaga pinensis]TWV95182.1 hypothetical protein FEF09_24650 [Chitinophaga pinensis]
MKRIKLLFALTAVLAGAGTAIATTGKPGASSAVEVNRNWIDWNGDLLVNVPKSVADLYCASSIDICLRAQDNVYIIQMDIYLEFAVTIFIHQGADHPLMYLHLL